jgi:hypothetical protein
MLGPFLLAERLVGRNRAMASRSQADALKKRQKGFSRRRSGNERLEMGRRPEGSNLHHYRSDLRHLDGFAAAVLLSAHRLVEISLKGRREMTGAIMLDPAPELPDDTPIGDVKLPARIRNVLEAAGLKTERETSDDILLSFNDCGKNSLAYLREALGLPSTDGVRPP